MDLIEQKMIGTIADELADRLRATQPVRMKTLGYKNDGCTVCRHYIDGYPLSFLGSSDRNLYLSIFEDKYNNGLYKFYNKIDKNLFVEVFKFLGSDKMNHLQKTICEFVPYSGPEGFIRYMRRSCVTGEWIFDTHIMGLQLIGMTDLMYQCMSAKKKLIEIREKKEQEQQEELRRMEKERIAREEKERLAALHELEQALRSNIEVSGLHEKADLVLMLLDQYNIPVPVRTKGWIRDCLASAVFNADGTVSYKYFKKKRANGSQKMFAILEDLRKAICESHESF